MATEEVIRSEFAKLEAMIALIEKTFSEGSMSGSLVYRHRGEPLCHLSLLGGRWEVRMPSPSMNYARFDGGTNLDGEHAVALIQDAIKAWVKALSDRVELFRSLREQTHKCLVEIQAIATGEPCTPR